MPAAAAKTEAPAPLSVQAAIAEVMKRLPAIGKGETAPGAMGGFKYRGIEAMTKVIQPILAEVGLVIIPNASLEELRPAPGMKSEAWQDTILAVDWTIIGPDGSAQSARTIGIGRDQTDKGATKAQTQAYKYLLMHLFCVSDADDDGDGHDYSMEPDADDPPTPGYVITFERVKQWVEKGDAYVGYVKALGEKMGRKFTINDLRDHPDFHDAVVELLDAFDAREAQEAHSGPQAAPDETER